MSGNGATIDIGKHPENRSGEVQKDGKGYYYESTGEIVLTEDWYPDLEGTYRKLTHSLKDGKISKIKKGYQGLNTDETCSIPLLIQLGNEDSSVYYTDPGGSNNWNQQREITVNTLREILNKQNCDRNQAHIVKIAEKPSSSTSYYNCPGCQTRRIQVSYSGSSGGTTFYQPIPASGTFSVTSFKDKNVGTWQLGLPSLKDVKEITVYWTNTSGKTPILVAKSRPYRYFRRSSSDSNTWIEVSNAGSSLQTPNLALDLSKSSGITYDGGGSKINITVLRSHIGEGYYGYQYSLRGAPFMISGINHGQGTTLSGISSNDPLVSVSGYYYGGNNPTDQSNILLIEVVTSISSTEYKYSYYQKDKDGTDWTPLSRPGGYTDKLVGEALKVTLDKLKELKETLHELNKRQEELNQLKTNLDRLNKKLNESHNTGVIAGTSVGTGLGGAGLGGLAVWRGPALIARLIARL